LHYGGFRLRYQIDKWQLPLPGLDPSARPNGQTQAIPLSGLKPDAE
jgi:hypothetical protein